MEGCQYVKNGHPLPHYGYKSCDAGTLQTYINWTQIGPIFRIIIFVLHKVLARVGIELIVLDAGRNGDAIS